MFEVWSNLGLRKRLAWAIIGLPSTYKFGFLKGEKKDIKTLIFDKLSNEDVIYPKDIAKELCVPTTLVIEVCEELVNGGDLCYDI